MQVEITNNNDTLTARLIGHLDTAASSQFAIDMQPILDNASKHIILDCSQMDFISSSGLRLFLAMRKATIAAGGDITIQGVTDEVKQVFSITGFYSLFNFA